MENTDIMVSVYCLTYNHENYITQALDSILMQKTQYSMEVLVGEDCSTDNTRAVLKEYEKQHLGKFQIFYREHNMSKEKIGNAKDLILRCKGKYIICLECDDFWTDENKIEKQVAFLETHPEYLAVAHNCVVVGEDSKPTGENYPECKDTEYTMEHYKRDILPGQSATVMYRNCYLEKLFDTSFMDLKMLPGDRRNYFSFIANGRVYCMQEIMSAYRHVYKSGSSFCATYKYNYDNSYKWNLAQLEYAYRINKPEAIRCAELLFAMGIQFGLKGGHITLQRAIKDYAPVKHKTRTLYALFIRNIKRAWQIVTGKSPHYLES